MENNTDHKLLLRATEVAAALGVSRAAAYEMIASGTLPVVRFGRAVRVPAQALSDWVARATLRPATDPDGTPKIADALGSRRCGGHANRRTR